jgi:hypothetical protein
MSDLMDISGHPGPTEAAAIAAIIGQLTEEARAAAARPSGAPRPSPWVQSWRPREMHNPLPSHVYDAQPWIADGEDH